jgi:hypothetical protein
VIERILAIRDTPPEGLRRIPGPQAIVYYLRRDPVVQTQQLPVPSERTIYRILKQHDRIPQRTKRPHEPMERAAPMTNWQLDAHSMSPVSQPIRRANSNRWWKPSMS